MVPRLDRLRLLLIRERCKAALSDPELPDEIRAPYKQAMDHVEVALGLDSARARPARLKPANTSLRGRTLRLIAERCSARATDKSYADCRFSQNSGLVPK